MTEADWLRVMSGEDRRPHATLLRGGLALGEPAYAAAMRLRNALYDRGFKPAARLPHPTISVGNLTTGGTGKTPVVRDVVRRLEAAGRSPTVLLRGYRQDATGESDELAEYRELGVRAAANPDRVAGSSAALAEWPATDAFVLDDGFQHRRVTRDLDLVLVDATRPWGYGHVLPRGLLREPRAALRRADAVIVTRANHATPDALRTLDHEIVRSHGRPPLAHVRHAWVRWHGASFDWLRGAPVWAFCGIGNSGAFFQQCRQVLSRVVGQRAYADHHAYDADTIDAILRAARDAGAEAFVTTMKDWVKLKPRWPEGGPPVAVPEVGIEFLDGEDATDRLLRAAVAGGHGPV